MDKQTQAYVDSFMAELIAKNPGEKEFHQAVKEVVESVAPMIIADELRYRSVQRRYPLPREREP